MNENFIFTLEREFTYVFNAFDNKSRPEEFQMRAVIRNLSQADQQRILVESMDDIEVVDGKAKINPKKGMGAAFAVENFKIKELQNIKYIEGDQEKEIKTFQELTETPAEWAIELANELRMFLAKTELPEKN